MIEEIKNHDNGNAKLTIGDGEMSEAECGPLSWDEKQEAPEDSSNEYRVFVGPYIDNAEGIVVKADYFQLESDGVVYFYAGEELAASFKADEWFVVKRSSNG